MFNEGDLKWAVRKYTALCNENNKPEGKQLINFNKAKDILEQYISDRSEWVYKTGQTEVK